MEDRETLIERKTRLLRNMEDYRDSFREEGQEPPYTPECMRQCDQILTVFLDAVLPGPKPDAEILAHTERAVKALNALNESCGYSLIETDEREQLCDIFIEAARAVGYAFPGKEEDITFQWRDW